MRIKDWANALMGFAPKPAEDSKARQDLRQIVPLQAARRAQHRRFEAAAFSRLNDDFLATSTAIDQELRSDLDALVKRSRMGRKNDPLMIKFAKMCRTNLVGAAQPFGFTFQSRIYNPTTAANSTPQPDTLANNAIEAGMAKWSRVCDVTGKHKSLRSWLATAVDVLSTDGEVLAMKHYGDNAKNPFGFALQLLDTRRLDTQYTVTRNEYGNQVIMGVELDSMQRKIAFHIWEQPPGGVAGQGRRVRVLARNVIHFGINEFAEQTRYPPWAYGVMQRLHQLKGYNEAAIIAARWGASKMGFYTKTGEAPPPLGENGAIADQRDGDGQLLSTVSPGELNELPMGYDFKPFDPTYPHEQFGEFNKAAERHIASGLGVARHSLGNDLEGVNFSSIRGGVLEERDFWMCLQSEIIEGILFEITEDVLRMGLLNEQFVMPNGSALPLSKFEKFANFYWQGRRWTWVDPLKDVQASAMAVEKKQASPQDIAAQNGKDLEDVLLDIKRANEMAKAAGVSPFVSLEEAPTQRPKKPQPDDPEDGGE